jgi:hypothetical protein
MNAAAVSLNSARNSNIEPGCPVPLLVAVARFPFQIVEKPILLDQFACFGV